MNIIQQAHQLFEELYTQAKELYPELELPRIPLEISARMNRTGGTFSYNIRGSVKIKMSKSLLEAHGERFLNQVLKHEFAHFIAHELYGSDIQPHGTEWKRVMRSLGERPTRCHNFKPVKGVETYTVAGKKFQIGTRKHNRIQQGHSYFVRIEGRRVDIDRTMWDRSGKPARKPRANKTRTVKGQTKANRMRKLLQEFTNRESALVATHLLAAQCDLSPGLARTYIRNLWATRANV